MSLPLPHPPLIPPPPSSSSSPPHQVITFDVKHHSHLIPYLAAIHAGCITHDRTIATFLPPLAQDKLLAWWRESIMEVASGLRSIYMLVNVNPIAAAAAEAVAAGYTSFSAMIQGPDLVGVVMAVGCREQTNAFRASVDKLMIDKSFRGRGGARALMAALEADAPRHGHSFLVLDVETGTPAEAVFAKLGYTQAGRIPGYAQSPSREHKECSLFYKRLVTTNNTPAT